MGREIDVKEFVANKKEEIKTKVSGLTKVSGETPRLVVVQLGDNEASNKYVGNKVKVGGEIGVEVEVLKLDQNTPQWILERILENSDCPTIVQCPVPNHINLDKAIKKLNPVFDVDGFTIEQKGLLFNGSDKALVPATALGVFELLKSITDLEGKDVAIINRSHLIGKPLAQLLTNANATVTLCHSKSRHISFNMGNADIVVTGCGKRKIFNEHSTSRRAIVVDCSMDKEEGIVGVGDFDKESVVEGDNDIQIASGYGATGLLTTCYLMENVVKSYLNRK